MITIGTVLLHQERARKRCPSILVDMDDMRKNFALFVDAHDGF